MISRNCGSAPQQHLSNVALVVLSLCIRSVCVTVGLCTLHSPQKLSFQSTHTRHVNFSRQLCKESCHSRGNKFTVQNIGKTTAIFSWIATGEDPSLQSIDGCVSNVGQNRYEFSKIYIFLKFVCRLVVQSSVHLAISGPLVLPHLQELLLLLRCAQSGSKRP